MSNDQKKTVPDAPVISLLPDKKVDSAGDEAEIPPKPILNPDGSYTLKQPLDMGGRKVETVTPRRLTGKDQIEIELEIQATIPGMDYGSVGSGQRMLRLIGKSCGLIFEDVQQMDAADLNALSGVVDGFL